jgi:hypothetical protein
MTPQEEIRKLKQNNRELAELLIQACKALDAEYAKTARLTGQVAKAKSEKPEVGGVFEDIFKRAATEGLPNSFRRDERRIVKL